MKMAQMKYGHLVKGIPSFKDYGQGSYRQGTEMNGKFLGYDLNIKYGTFYNSGNLEPFRTQVCDYDQILIWMGTNTYDLGYLGAQVDFCIGEEKEKHRITTATAVSIPREHHIILFLSARWMTVYTPDDFHGIQSESQAN